jgi:RNA polymerase sigma-70 factor, ECF subfamily
MSEGKQVVAGEAILNGLAPVESKAESTAVERSHGTLQDRTLQKDDEVIEALVHEHSRMVYRIAYAVLRRHHDAEDATQETFMRVLRYSSKLADVQEPKTWLARIAWRVAVDRSRMHSQRREISLDDPEKSVPDVASSESPADETVHGVQVGTALKKWIAALPAKLREPLILSTLEEMSPREVGATLGINEAAVRSRVFRARQILKAKLASQIGVKQAGEKS